MERAPSADRVEEEFTVLVVRFTWKPGEWREAYLLATTEEDRTAGPVPMGYPILGLTLAGCVGDLWRATSHHRGQMLHDSMVPMLALLCALALALAVVLGLLQRSDRMRGMPAVPRGEQQVTLHELGWGVASGGAAASRVEVRSWSELCGQRTGRQVLTLLKRDGGAVSLPLRALNQDQGSWLERMLQRKVQRFA